MTIILSWTKIIIKFWFKFYLNFYYKILREIMKSNAIISTSQYTALLQKKLKSRKLKIKDNKHLDTVTYNNQYNLNQLIS